MFGINRKPIVRVITKTQTIQVRPDAKKFIAKDEFSETLAQRYVAICDDIEPYIGKSHSRDYTTRQLGKLDEIVDILAVFTGREKISLVYQLDKRFHEERVAAKDAARAEVNAADVDTLLILDAAKVAETV